MCVCAHSCVPQFPWALHWCPSGDESFESDSLREAAPAQHVLNGPGCLSHDPTSESQLPLDAGSGALGPSSPQAGLPWLPLHCPVWATLGPWEPVTLLGSLPGGSHCEVVGGGAFYSWNPVFTLVLCSPCVLWDYVIPLPSAALQ